MARGDTSNPGDKNKTGPMGRKAGARSKGVERDFCHGDCVTEGDKTPDAAAMRKRYDRHYEDEDSTGW